MVVVCAYFFLPPTYDFRQIIYLGGAAIFTPFLKVKTTSPSAFYDAMRFFWLALIYLSYSLPFRRLNQLWPVTEISYTEIIIRVDINILIENFSGMDC